ncbi:hypothetical protein ABK040_007487 [Willaertia magna]
MNSRVLTSDEVNFMIYRYLQESGFKHSAFTFGSECNIQNCPINGSEVPPGALISFLQKGIQFLEVETRLKSKINTSDNIKYDSVFELLLPEIPKEKLFVRNIPKQNDLLLSKEVPNQQQSSNVTNSSITSSSSIPQTTTTTTTTGKTSRRKNSTATTNEKPSTTSSTTRSTSSNNTASTTNNGRPNKKQKQTAMDEEEIIPNNATNLGTTEEIIPEELVTKLKGHSHEVFICSWNPARSNVLASGSGDSTARIWELPPGEIGARAVPLNPIVLHHGDEKDGATSKDVTTLDWSGDGKKLATGSYDGKARIWTDKGELKCTLDQHRGPIFSLKWNKAGNYLLSGSVDYTAIVWDVATASVKQQFSNHSAPTLDVDWRNNTTFATCSTDKMIYVYELGKKDPLRAFAGHEDEVNAIRWNPSGTLLASCSDDFTAKIWSMDKQQCVWDFREHTKEIYTIKWSPTGPGTEYPNKNVVLASASFDATIKIWDVTYGKCLYSLTKHSDPVYSVAFSPDGKFLASGSFDRCLHIWSVADGKLVKTYNGSGSIFEVCWNSTGDKVAACFSNSITEEFNVCVLDFRY